MSVNDDALGSCTEYGYVYSTWTTDPTVMTIGTNFTIGPDEYWKKPPLLDHNVIRNCDKMDCSTSLDEWKKLYNFVEVPMHSDVLDKLDANATTEWSVVQTSELQLSDPAHTNLCHYVGAEGDPLYMCHNESVGISLTGLKICATNGLGCMDTVFMCHWMDNGRIRGCAEKTSGTETGFSGCHVTTPGDILFTGLRERIMV